MSLSGMMRTGASGMNAQASRLGTVADNIANANTTGYKKASTEFSSLLLGSNGGAYNSGGVTTDVRYSISEKGPLEFTTSKTDLAINGNGFFIVSDSNGLPFLTRAGSFIPDANGSLVNAAGFTLMGYDYQSGIPAPVVNGFDGLVPVNISAGNLNAVPSANGVFTANLSAGETVIAAANLPSTNSASSEYTHKSSLVVYDNLGDEMLLDFYYTKSAANTWEVAVYDRADAAPSTSFPYASAALATTTLNFDPSNGLLTGASANSITLAVPNGSSLNIDLANMSQLDYQFTVQNATVDGSKPSAVSRVEIAEDGIVYAQYENGKLDPIFRLAMANVPSPDELRPLSGNVYTQGTNSGVVRTGFAGSSNFGKIVSGALESSNVDIAEELTNMIESQRSYTANSKVFQTGSDLMDVLVNLKR